MANEPTTAGVRQYPRLVIFDFDGVIADSEMIALEELAAEMTERGAATSYEEARALFLGMSTARHMAYISERSGAPCAPDFPDVWHSRLYRRYQAELTIMDGAVALLDGLQSHDIDFCIASGGSPERIAFALSRLGLTERFANVAFSAESVPRGKPAPDLFLHAAAQIGHSVGDCIVVEDAASGAEAAKAAGMPCIGFLGGSHLDGYRDIQRQLLSKTGVTSFAENYRELQALLLGDPPEPRRV